MMDIAKLKAAAEKAQAARTRLESMPDDVVLLENEGIKSDVSACNKFIAAANPAAVLELIAQNEALVAAHVNLKLLADVYRQAYEEALEAKDAQIAELLEKQRLIDICQGQGLEHRIAAEKRAEAAEKRIAELESEEVRQRLANAEHQLHMAELAKHNLKASRKAQFKKRKAAEARIAELESRTLRVNMPALRNTEMMSDLAWNSAIDQCFDALIKATDEAGINLETGGE